MRLRIAVTDNDWFRFLRSQPDVDEVNFWKPGGVQPFYGLNPGELLLFKLHAPENFFITGGGFFIHFTFLPYTLAWETFGHKNGVPSLEQMKRRIEKYRRRQSNPEAVDLNSRIGCIVLGQPFFFPDDQWIPSPPDFRLSTVQGKTFEPDTEHQIDNGLLLRSDVHRLFDKGYVTITPDGRFHVSHRLKVDFDNGEPYMPFHGKKIWMPGDPARQPNREAPEWHAGTLFLR